MKDGNLDLKNYIPTTEETKEHTMLKRKPSLQVGRLISDLATIGDKKSDTEQDKIQHHLLVYMGLFMGFGGVLWGTISAYFQLFLPASIPYGYSILTFINFFFFYQTKNFQRARFVQVLMSLILPFMFQWSLGGFVSSGAMMLWSMLGLVGSTTFHEPKWGIRWLGMYVLLTLFSGVIDGYVEANFGLNLSTFTKTYFFVINITIITSLVFGLSLYLLNLLRLSQVNLEQLVVERTSELNEVLSSMEQRVTHRTRALEASTEVSRRLSTILDPDQLVEEVVEQVQQALNYYHAHIYLWDDRHENLVMVGGTGEAGRTMLKNRHSIPAGRGLVGRAAETNQAVLVLETTADLNWLPNPLLPDTKSEVAVPIAVGDNVLGVLDVQHNITGGLKQDDADLLQAIASQVAIALQNAQAYEVTRRKAEQETIVNTLAQEIQRATRVEEVMQIIASGLGQSLNVKRAVVHIQNSTAANNRQE
jgi:putative methionine-R-sulfoxide reductase with GAF domain